MKDNNGISRRDLLLGAGVVAAGYAALAPLPAQAATEDPRSSAQLVIIVEVDGQPAGYASAVSGGGLRLDGAAMVDAAQQGLDKGAIAQQPVTIRFRSMPGAKFPDWFAARDLVPREVAIVLCDMQGGAELYRLSMSRTRIVGIRLPGFEGADSTKTPEFEVTFLASQSTHSVSNRAGRRGLAIPRTPSVLFGFSRLMIQGLESVAPTVSAVAPLAFEALPNLKSWKRTPLRFSSLLDANGTWYAWFNDARANGGKVARPAVLQFLSYEAAQLGTVDLTYCLPVAASSPFAGMQSSNRMPVVDVEMSFNEATLHIERLIG